MVAMMGRQAKLASEVRIIVSGVWCTKINTDSAVVCTGRGGKPCQARIAASPMIAIGF